jgi:hypothetical protein
MTRLYEIHCYQGDIFQYVVARTTRLSEEKVREDVEKMNHALASEKKGMRYVFVAPTNSKAAGGRNKITE